MVIIMNELIEKLAVKSLINVGGELIFSKEKFAQLIAEECVKICNNDNWEDQQGWGQHYAQQIQQKFKIKEH